MTSSPLFWVALFVGVTVVGTWVGLVVCVGARPMHAARITPRFALWGVKTLVRLVTGR